MMKPVGDVVYTVVTPVNGMQSLNVETTRIREVLLKETLPEKLQMMVIFIECQS